MYMQLNRPEHIPPLACESIGVNYKVYRPQGYWYYNWLQVTAGKGVIVIHGDTHVLTAGMGILISPGVPHHYYPDSTVLEWTTTFLTFYGEIADTVVNFVGGSAYAFFPNLTGIVGTFIQDHYADFEDSQWPALLHQSTIIYDFLMHLKALDVVNSADPFANAITQYIHDHFAEVITNTDLTRLTGLSVSAMTQGFKNNFGSMPLQYLTFYRLSRAKYLLLSRPDLQIQDISEQTGFSDVSSFIRTFRTANQLTPHQYRKQQRLAKTKCKRSLNGRI